MGLFARTQEDGHEQVVFFNDPAAGLKAIIAVHSTAAGPAIGGCRMWPYASEEEALEDVLRLSKGMTYKNISMGLAAGGAKAVIIGDPKKDKTPELMKAFGRCVERMGGIYYTGEDVGMTPDDMAAVRTVTRYVVGLRETSGDPSPVTAYGVFMGMRACLREAFGDESFEGRTVAVQGAGNVGYHLLKRLHGAGARLYVTDIDSERLERAVAETGATPVEPDAIYDLDCDIFAPCALGGIINEKTIDRLRCRIVAGSANNQLADETMGDALMERGILYAPDYVINGGGVINVYEELMPGGYDRERALAKVATIYDKIAGIFAAAKRWGVATNRAANRLAEERLAELTAKTV